MRIKRSLTKKIKLCCLHPSFPSLLAFKQSHTHLQSIQAYKATIREPDQRDEYFCFCEALSDINNILECKYILSCDMQTHLQPHKMQAHTNNRIHTKHFAVLLFGNMEIVKMRNTDEHQRVSDGKIQITF